MMFSGSKNNQVGNGDPGFTRTFLGMAFFFKVLNEEVISHVTVTILVNMHTFFFAFVEPFSWKVVA